MENTKKKWSALQIILFSVLAIYVISVLYVLLWGTITSFKSNAELIDEGNVLWFPKTFIFNQLEAFNQVAVPHPSGIGKYYVDQMLIYSILYAGGCAVMSTITPCIVAYLCAKFPYKFSSIVYMTVIVVMVIPIVGNQPAEIAMASALGIFDTIWGMWIMKTSFLGMYFLVFYATFSAIPNGYAEAAKIDGAGNVQILFQIILPLVKNTMVTVGLLMFINYWNDYAIPAVYLRSYPVIAYGLYYFTFENNTNGDVPLQMAGATILMIPILILFLVFQNRLMSNLTTGGLKG